MLDAHGVSQHLGSVEQLRCPEIVTGAMRDRREAVQAEDQSVHVPDSVGDLGALRERRRPCSSLPRPASAYPSIARASASPYRLPTSAGSRRLSVASGSARAGRARAEVDGARSPSTPAEPELVVDLPECLGGLLVELDRRSPVAGIGGGVSERAEAAGLAVSAAPAHGTAPAPPGRTPGPARYRRARSRSPRLRRGVPHVRLAAGSSRSARSIAVWPSS